MTRTHNYKIIVKVVMLVAGCIGVASIPVLAQSGGDYDLNWSTIDGGGGTSTGGD